MFSTPEDLKELRSLYAAHPYPQHRFWRALGQADGRGRHQSPCSSTASPARCRWLSLLAPGRSFSSQLSPQPDHCACCRDLWVQVLHPARARLLSAGAQRGGLPVQLPHAHRTAPGAPQGGVTLACSGRCSCLPACLPVGLSLFMLPGLLVRLLYSSPLDAGYEIKVAADGKLLKHRNLNTIDWQGRWQGMG